MYVRKTQFSTVGELMELLSELPNDSTVAICGDEGAFLYVNSDESVICLDNDDSLM